MCWVVNYLSLFPNCFNNACVWRRTLKHSLPDSQQYHLHFKTMYLLSAKYVNTIIHSPLCCSKTASFSSKEHKRRAFFIFMWTIPLTYTKGDVVQILGDDCLGTFANCRCKNTSWAHGFCESEHKQWKEKKLKQRAWGLGLSLK